MTDHRNEAARARDAWFESADGARCLEDGAKGIYLRNRLENAFLAGWNAAKLDKEP